MQVSALKISEVSVLLFCSPDAEHAASFVEPQDLGAILLRINTILEAALTFKPSFTIRLDAEIIAWARASSGNFLWLSSYALALHYEFFLYNDYFHDSYESFRIVSNSDIDQLPIGNFTDIPNCAYSFRHAADFRTVANPYTAYQMLAHAVSKKAR